MTQLQAVNTTYEPFSDEPEYLECNRAFIARPALSHVRRFLDLACGTGVVSEFLLGASPAAHLNGVDYDPVQIELITERFTRQGYKIRRGFALTSELAGGKPVLTFAVGSADELPFPEASFDCVTIANAIHVLPDKEKLLAAVARVLKPGGVFGFNSSFYAGTFPEGTHRFYTEWLKQAMTHIQRQSEQRLAAGQPPIKRVRGTSHKAFQNRWYSPAEWAERLSRHGLKVHDTHERVVMLDARCFAAVGAYGGLAEVLISGYPVEVASVALQSTAATAMNTTGANSIPRHWLEMWASKAT